MGNVGRLPLGDIGGRSAPFVLDDLTAALVAAILVVLLITRRIRPVLDRVSLPAVAFALIAVLSAVLGILRYHMGLGDAVGTLAYLARWLLYFGWYLFVAWCLTIEESRAAWGYIEKALLAFAAFGVFQSAFLPGFAQMVQGASVYPTWDMQGWRLVSTLLDPNLAGLLIVFAILFRLARIATGAKRQAGGWPLALLVVAVLLTLSRSTMLALVVGVVVMLMLGQLSFRLGYAFLAGGVVMIPTFWLVAGYASTLGRFSVNASALARITPWLRGIHLIAQHPVFGVGFDALKQAQLANGWVLLGDSHATLDGGLLLVAALTGTVGLAFYLWMLWNVWRMAGSTVADTDVSADDRAHALATAASTAALIVHSLFVNSLLLPFVMQIIWVMWATLSRIASAPRTRRAVLAVGAAVPLLVIAAGCQPCSGTDVCAPNSRVDLIGQIVDAHSGVPVSGARVDVSLGSGEQFTATSDGNGNWEAAHGVQSSLAVTANVTVTAPGHAGYAIPAFNVTPSIRHGGATLVGPWLSYPHVHYLATLVHNGKPLAGATVKFARTGGVAVTGTLTGTTDGNGTFSLFLDADELGTAVGTLTVTQSALAAPATLTGYQIPLGYQQKIASPQAQYSVGGLLAYGGQVFFRGTGRHVQGVGVKWTRTGGIAATPATLTTTTDSSGYFLIDLSTSSSGTVTGNLVLTPPSGPVTTYPNISLATYDSVAGRYLGNFGYGQQWAWVVELWRNDSLKPAPGTTVAFRRTGGLAISPDSVTFVTRADGRFTLQASITDTGAVKGDLIVTPKTGPARIIPGLQFHSYASDAVPFAGVYTFGPSLRYAAEIQDWAGTPIVGATVTWVQDSGLPATPTTLTATTDNIGYFHILIYPPNNTDGSVTGHLLVKPPPPYAPGSAFTIGNITLATYIGTNEPFAGVFAIPNP